MRSTSTDQLARFRRVRELVGPLTETTSLAAPVVELDGVIQRLKDHGEKQDQSHREMRALTQSLYLQARHLRADLMVPVELAARGLYPAGDAVGAEIRRTVRPPSHRADYEHLLHAARGLASAVEPRANEIVGMGLPPDFIAKLREGVATLENGVNARAAALQRRLAATQGIRVETRRGRELVKFIHSLIKPQLRLDAPRAAEWKRAMLVPRRASSGSGAGDVVVPAPEVAVDEAA